MKTKYLSESFDDLAVAAELLRKGELVAFPTETVYGVGACALNSDAVNKIFLAKGRPTDNPLIVHLSSQEQIHQVALDPDPLVRDLIDAFWPGPLTLVLQKRDLIPDLVTCNLSTVAIRIPNHAAAIELIRLAECPIAAPSANLSGRPSATTWQAVAEDLDGRIAAIICGKPCNYGVESTVVDVGNKPPRVLRPGGISLEALKLHCAEIMPYRTPSQNGPLTLENSPGLRHRHYQPKTRVILVDHDKHDVDATAQLLASQSHYMGLQSMALSTPFRSEVIFETMEAYAARLFEEFRRADAANAAAIFCETIPEIGIGVALMDRLRRAAS